MKIYVRADVSETKDQSKLARSEDWRDRAEAAKNTDDPQLLAQLAADEHVSVRYAVARKTDDPQLLSQLANDETYAIRQEVEFRHPEYTRKRKKQNWPDEDFWYDLEDDESFEDAWSTYLSGPENEINNKYNIFAEPSVQGGTGGMFLFDESGKNEESIEVDFQEWCDAEVDMAVSSRSASGYKKKYENYLKSLMKKAGWS